MMISDKLIDRYARKMFGAAYPATPWQHYPQGAQAKKQDRFKREAKVLLVSLLEDDEFSKLAAEQWYNDK